MLRLRRRMRGRSSSMSRDRGQRRNHESVRQRGRAGTRTVLVNLAQGVQLLPGRADASCVLVSPNGRVQLNDGATAILRLCDGSRTSEQIVAEVTRVSTGETLASDVAEFLDVARSRGWIVAL
jgi:pyrroloquinoline quinone biosynthesis protein D